VVRAAGAAGAGKAILVAALGCWRRTSDKLLKDACAAFNDRFRIEEQKSAVATATAVRDPGCVKTRPEDCSPIT
jgi:hypothetical protein